MDAKWIASPNFTAGRRGYKPEAVVVHIMEGTLTGTDSWFRNRDSKVSAHYGIGTSGEIHQYVKEADAAWHAGRKSSNAPWSLLKPGVNPNYYTVGIEHEGRADDPWTDEMYTASAGLIHRLCMRWDIPVDRNHIIGHREIYTVKTCPGSRVSLNKLVGLVRDQVEEVTRYNFVDQPATLEIRKTLNIRQGAPTTRARIAARASSGDLLASVGWTSNGQAVDGNAHWYKDADGNYFWAGGTRSPIPGLD